MSIISDTLCDQHGVSENAFALTPFGSADDQTLGESLLPMFSRHIQELRRLVDKFREGTLTMEEALGGYVFFYTIGPFLMMSLISGFFIDTEIEWTDDKRVFYLNVFLFFLFFIWIMILLSRSLPRQPSLHIWIFRTIGAAVAVSILSFMCLGIFAFWNAVSSTDEAVLVSGPVVKKAIASGSRFSGKVRYISIRHRDRDIKLTVAPEEYENLNLGQAYSRKMRLGGLGYYYNWGPSWWK